MSCGVTSVRPFSCDVAAFQSKSEFSSARWFVLNAKDLAGDDCVGCRLVILILTAINQLSRTK